MSEINEIDDSSSLDNWYVKSIHSESNVMESSESESPPTVYALPGASQERFRDESICSQYILSLKAYSKMELGEFKAIPPLNIHYSSPVEALGHYEWLGRDFDDLGPIYLAIRANDVNAVSLMLNLVGYPRRAFRDHKGESSFVRNNNRLNKIISLLNYLFTLKKGCPIESLEILLRNKEIYNFPLISFNYDLDLFMLGVNYGVVKDYFEIYEIVGGAGSYYKNRVIGPGISIYLKKQPDDSAEIIKKKNEMYEILRKLGYKY
jgi:hypothetical protein